MDIDALIYKYEKEIINLSRNIYDFAELGSSEFKSSSLVMEKLKEAGFKIDNPYMNMNTAFRAEYGSGTPSVGILMEYDALPNGHSCGHNLIAAWAFGTAMILREIITSGKIVVYGTPSEEGIGEYAGSKARMAEKGAFNGIDFVLGMHPDDQWAVGSKALADAEMEFTFHGKSSHMAASPCFGINALDALATSYNAINNMRGWARGDRNIVIGMVIREGGKASNVVPDLAILEVDIRSNNYEFLGRIVSKIKKLVKGISDGYETVLEIKDLMPIYSEYKPNKTIDNIIMAQLDGMGVPACNIDNMDEPAYGSTDEANVSLVVPTGHIDMKIGTGLPGHSDQFREAAAPERARKNLIIAIKAAVNAIVEIMNDKKIIEKIKEEFNAYDRKN
ncbi:MAG: amidohydrolase [Ferroplasma sp.]